MIDVSELNISDSIVSLNSDKRDFLIEKIISSHCEIDGEYFFSREYRCGCGLVDIACEIGRDIHIVEVKKDKFNISHVEQILAYKNAIESTGRYENVICHIVCSGIRYKKPYINILKHLLVNGKFYIHTLEVKLIEESIIKTYKDVDISYKNEIPEFKGKSRIAFVDKKKTFDLEFKMIGNASKQDHEIKDQIILTKQIGYNNKIKDEIRDLLLKKQVRPSIRGVREVFCKSGDPIDNNVISEILSQMEIAGFLIKKGKGYAYY